MKFLFVILSSFLIINSVNKTQFEKIYSAYVCFLGVVLVLDTKYIIVSIFSIILNFIFPFD